MAAARVSGTVDAITARHPGRDIVAVAHMGVILTQIARALGDDAKSAMSHRIDPLSVTRLTWDGGWRLGPINHRP